MTPIDELNQAFTNLEALLNDNVHFPLWVDQELYNIALLQQQQIADLNERLSKLENKNK